MSPVQTLWITTGWRSWWQITSSMYRELVLTWISSSRLNWRLARAFSSISDSVCASVSLVERHRRKHVFLETRSHTHTHSQTQTQTHTHTHVFFLWIVRTFHWLLLHLYWTNNIFYTLTLTLTGNRFALLHFQTNTIYYLKNNNCPVGILSLTSQCGLRAPWPLPAVGFEPGHGRTQRWVFGCERTVESGPLWVERLSLRLPHVETPDFSPDLLSLLAPLREHTDIPNESNYYQKINTN